MIYQRILKNSLYKLWALKRYESYHTLTGKSLGLYVMIKPYFYQYSIQERIRHKAVAVRTLYSTYLLGIDGFRQNNADVRKCILVNADVFEKNISDIVNNDNEIVISGDVKNLIALCEQKPELLRLTLEAAKKYNKYVYQMKMSPFRFGPMIMRLLHCFNNPEIALKVYQDEAFEDMFRHAASSQILMDMLLANQQYRETIDVVNAVVDENLAPLPQSCLTLALAANYKINTKESFEHSLHLLRKHKEWGKSPTFRAIAFAAAHALKQDELNEAAELISHSVSTNHYLMHNLELLIKCRLGRTAEILENLRVRALIDTPKLTVHSARVLICRDVLNDMEKYIMDSLILKSESESHIKIFNKLKNILEESKLISDQTLEECLFRTIDIPESVKLQEDIKNLRRSSKQDFNRPNKRL